MCWRDSIVWGIQRHCVLVPWIARRDLTARKIHRARGVRRICRVDGVSDGWRVYLDRTTGSRQPRACPTAIIVYSISLPKLGVRLAMLRNSDEIMIAR